MATALMPTLSSSFRNGAANLEKPWNFIYGLLVLYSILSILFCAFFAEELIFILAGSEFSLSAEILRYMLIGLPGAIIIPSYISLAILSGRTNILVISYALMVSVASILVGVFYADWSINSLALLFSVLNACHMMCLALYFRNSLQLKITHVFLGFKLLIVLLFLSLSFYLIKRYGFSEIFNLAFAGILCAYILYLGSARLTTRYPS